MRDRLAAALPPTASLANPVDLVGDADATRYSHALHAIGGAAADAALVMLTGPGGDRRPRGGAGGDRRDPGLEHSGRRRLRRRRASRRACARSRRPGIPCYPFPEPAVRTLAGMARLWERRGQAGRARSSGRARRTRRPPRSRGCAPAGCPALGMSRLETVLTSYGIAVLPSQAVETAEEAASAAERLGFPWRSSCAPRTSATRRRWAECISAFRRHPRSRRRRLAMLARVRAARPEARIDGVLVQPMAPHGVEFLLGMIRDPQFGPMVVVGFGGIYVEVLKDTAARLCPLDRCEALDMLAELRMAPCSTAHGEPPVNKDRLAEAICRFAQLAVDATDVAELEVRSARGRSRRRGRRGRASTHGIGEAPWAFERASGRTRNPIGRPRLPRWSARAPVARRTTRGRPRSPSADPDKAGDGGPRGLALDRARRSTARPILAAPPHSPPAWLRRRADA